MKIVGEGGTTNDILLYYAEVCCHGDSSLVSGSGSEGQNTVHTQSLSEHLQRVQHSVSIRIHNTGNGIKQSLNQKEHL